MKKLGRKSAAKTKFTPTKRRLSLRVPLFSLGGLVLLSSALVLPVISRNTSADSAAFNTTNNVTIAESLSLSTSSNDISTTFTPDATKNTATLRTIPVVVNVSTNISSGYQLTMTSSTASNTALTSSSSSIPTLTSATTVANFPVNQWGYSLDYQSSASPSTGNFYAILPLGSTAGTSIKTTSAAAETSQTVVTFGTKINMDKPAGDYASTVTFTAVSPKPVTPVDPPTPPVNPDPVTPTPVPSQDAPSPNLASTSYSSGNSGSSTGSSENTTPEQTNPQGVRELSLSDDSEGDGVSVLAITAAATAVVAASSGIIFFVLKRRNDDDDDEEENGEGTTPDSNYTY